VALAPKGPPEKSNIDGRNTFISNGWGRDGSYFTRRRGGSMHGRVFYLHEMRYDSKKNVLMSAYRSIIEALGEWRTRVSHPMGRGRSDPRRHLERGHVRGSRRKGPRVPPESETRCGRRPLKEFEVAIQRTNRLQRSKQARLALRYERRIAGRCLPAFFFFLLLWRGSWSELAKEIGPGRAAAGV